MFGIPVTSTGRWRRPGRRWVFRYDTAAKISGLFGPESWLHEQWSSRIPHLFKPGWLEPFFKFLTTLDNPFLILLQDKSPDRLYFGRHLFDRVKRKNELKIYHLQKAYRMKQKGGKVVGFSGLTLCCYFPKQWRLEFDASNYSRVIPTYSLHSAWLSKL